jgi:hypothetical protein
MWLVQACGGNAAGFVSFAVAAEAIACPVAVRIVIDGLQLLMVVMGAVGMK